MVLKLVKPENECLGEASRDYGQVDTDCTHFTGLFSFWFSFYKASVFLSIGSPRGTCVLE